MKVCMRNHTHTLLLAISLSPLLACQAGKENQTVKSIDPEDLPYKLEVLQEQQVDTRRVSHVATDLDGDGMSEMITVGHGKTYGISTINYITMSNYTIAKARWQHNFAGDISVDFLDLDQDGSFEIFVSEQIGDTVFINILDKNEQLLARFPAVSGKPRGIHPWQSSVHPVGILDADDNGELDLVLRVSTDYAYQPRGLWAFNWRTGAELWRYPMGPNPHQVAIADIDGDSKPEILAGSKAPGNGGGELVNGTDDFHSYFIMLDRRGNRLVQRQMGGLFSGVSPYIHDFDHDGNPEVLVIRESRNDAVRVKSRIGFWDLQTQRLIPGIETERQASDVLLIFDYDLDGIDDYLTTWTDGALEIRNISSKILAEIQLAEPVPNIRMRADITNDGIPELLVSTSSILFILDEKLKIIALYPKPIHSVQLVSTGFGKEKQVLLTGIEKLYRMRMVRNYPAVFHFSWQLFWGFLLGGVFFGVIGLLLFKKYQTTTLLRNQYLNQSKQAIAWAAMAQRLAHQIKTPLSSVMLAVQRLQMEYRRDAIAKAAVYDRYVNYVAGEVRRLRQVTDGFLKLARLEEPDLRPKDLNAMVRNCLQKLPLQNLQSIQVEMDLAEDLPIVNLDENQVCIALDVLLENSLQAMEDQGRLTVTTRSAQTLQSRREHESADFVRIEIADTGCGFPAEDREQLFDPFFTTKEGGTGLGLTIAQKIIHDHKGTIEINSAMGIGTVIVVTLPVGI